MSYSILEIFLLVVLFLFLLSMTFIAIKVINSNIENILKFLLITLLLLLLLLLLLFVPVIVIGLLINSVVLIKRNQFTVKLGSLKFK